MAELCSGLVKNTTLKELCVSRADKPAIDLLVKTLADNQAKIETLKLPTGRLSDCNVNDLAEALRTNTMLQSLGLNCCDLNETRCRTLCEGLTRNSTLQRLWMNFEAIDTEVLTIFCEYMKQNKSLEQLDLTGTRITDEGGKLLADMLLVNKTLKRFVCLSKAEDPGLKHLCHALKTNTTLRYLACGIKSVFGIDSMTGVKEMLAVNTTLEQLHITCNHSSEEGIDLVCEGLKQNSSLRCIAIRTESKLIEEKITQALEHNYAVDDVQLRVPINSRELLERLDRNTLLKSEAKYKVAVLSHNIARSKEALTNLPREIWISILSSVTHPGMPGYSFNTLVENIFGSYNDRKENSSHC